MKKKINLGTVLVLSLAFIVSATCVDPAFALVTYYDHGSTGGVTVIDIAEHQPPVQITVVHYDRGDHGIGDYLEVAMWQFVPPLGRSVWVTVAVVTDSPTIAAFSKDFVYAGVPGGPISVLLVKPCQLQIFKICKIVSAYWTVPIETSALTLPPGLLLLRGYGRVQTDEQVFSLPNGITWTVEAAALNAHATFICPTWKYFGSVGDESATMNIGLDQWITRA